LIVERAGVTAFFSFEIREMNDRWGSPFGVRPRWFESAWEHLRVTRAGTRVRLVREIQKIRIVIFREVRPRSSSSIALKWRGFRKKVDKFWFRSAWSDQGRSRINCLELS
jgi:hypothetical protein